MDTPFMDLYELTQFKINWIKNFSVRPYGREEKELHDMLEYIELRVDGELVKREFFNVIVQEAGPI